MSTHIQIATLIVLAILGYILYPMVARQLEERNLLIPDDGWTMPVDRETDEVAKRFPYPEILSLGEITGDWQDIPHQYMPEEISVTSDTTMILDNGGETLALPSGATLIPLGQLADGSLEVRHHPAGDGDGVTGIVELEATDIVELMTARYREGVANIIARIHGIRETERQRLATVGELSDQQLEERTGTPPPQTQQDKQAYINIAKENVAEGNLDGITTDMIKEWRWVGYEEVDGTGYWAVAAIYPQKTHFGTFETQAIAYIRNNQVAQWSRY